MDPQPRCHPKANPEKADTPQSIQKDPRAALSPSCHFSRWEDYGGFIDRRTGSQAILSHALAVCPYANCLTSLGPDNPNKEKLMAKPIL